MMGWWSYGNPNLFYSQASANSANKDIHVLQCHGDADPMVPFVFGTQTAEKMKSLINPSNITFKTYRGLSHSACPEVSVVGGVGGVWVRTESHQCLCTFCFLPVCVCAGNCGYQTVHREAASAPQRWVNSEVRGRHSEPSDCFWTSSRAWWDVSVHTFKVTTVPRCWSHRGQRWR